MRNEGIERLSAEEQLQQDAIGWYIEQRGTNVNDDGTVTLYHATNGENVESILKNGFEGTNAPIAGAPSEDIAPRSFFGSSKDWVSETWGGKGMEIIEAKIPAQYLRQGSAANVLEFYVEGRITYRGDGLWVPNENPTSTFFDRKAVKRYLSGGRK